MVETQIIEGPVSLDTLRPTPGTGAQLVFEGVVRPQENGATIGGLQYEAYRPMADRQLSSIAEALGRKFELLSLRVVHSVGAVPVGERSLVVVACAPHREEAFRAIEELITSLKRDVPIWKSPIAAVS